MNNNSIGDSGLNDGQENKVSSASKMKSLVEQRQQLEPPS